MSLSIEAQTVVEVYNSETVRGDIFGCFSNVNNFRPEANSAVLSAMIVEPTVMKGYVKFGDSRSNCSQLWHFMTNDNDAGRRTLWQNALMSFAEKYVDAFVVSCFAQLVFAARQSDSF